MFSIPVGDLLASYTGDSKEFSFSGAIYDGYFEDITFTEDLSFHIKLIGLDDGVETIFENLETEVVYDGKKYRIAIGGFEREFRMNVEDDAPDDIRRIEGGSVINLAPVIREEIIMACHM